MQMSRKGDISNVDMLVSDINRTEGFKMVGIHQKFRMYEASLYGELGYIAHTKAPTPLAPP